MSLTVAQIQKLAENKIKPEVVNVLFTEIPMLREMLSNQDVDFAGGNSHEWMINYDYNDAQWMSQGDTLDTADKTKRTAAELNWRDVVVPWKVNITDMEENDSPEGITNLVMEEKKQAKTSMRNRLGTDLYEGTGDKINNDNSPRITGWETIVGTGSYAGIDPSSDITTAADWQAAKDDGSTNTLNLSDMNDAYWETAKDYGFQISHIFTNIATMKKIWELAQSSEQFHNISGDSTFEVGAAKITFNGVPIIPDPYCPGSGGGESDNHIYFLTLNQDEVKFFIHDGTRMKFEEPRQPVNQLVLISYLRMKCQLVSYQRKIHSRFTAIDPDN